MKTKMHCENCDCLWTTNLVDEDLKPGVACPRCGEAIRIMEELP